MFVFIKFFILIAIVLVAGEKLSVYAGGIAKKTGLSQGFIGATLVAAITSFPELMSGISSIAVVKSPDMLFGEIVGSCMFNLSILALVNIIIKRENLFYRVSKRHKISGLSNVGVLMLILLFFYLKLGTIYFIGIPSLIILTYYVFAIYFIYKKEELEDEEEESEEKNLFLKFSFYSLFIIVASFYLPIVAEEIAKKYGLTMSFAGIVFVGIVTSLPELAVSVSAARHKLLGISVGNIFGSNLFNLTIPSMVDVFYTKGSIWHGVNEGIFLSFFITFFITLFIVLQYRITKKEKKTFKHFSTSSLLIFISYLIVLLITFIWGK